MKLKILSWNIWIDGNFNQVTDFLKASGADIIGLQEVVDNDLKRDVIGFLMELGYKHVYSSVKHSWGNNVYTDGPVVFSKFGILDSESYVLSKIEPRGAVRADIQVNGKIIHVFSTHLVHTHQQPSSIQEEMGLELLKQIPIESSVLMGDFNATPESAVIKNMRHALVDSDLDSQPTWSVYPEGCIVCKPKGLDIKLDYIFTTKDLKISGFKVESSKASDHLPISLIIEI